MFQLHYSALSDVGRVRKNNQDSGYAGPWLLAVCDGVGGAARGDIASATAISQLRRLDTAVPGADDAGHGHDPEALLGEVAGALHRAQDRIAELVDDDPTLMGTSTCATIARFDGEQIAIGHVGDSRAYLLRDGVLQQLTRDHTFVQSLIDEGRITEDEARVHPHRHVILRALDGTTDLEPDLFVVPLQAGDRLFLCSDGACGFLDDLELTALLADGTPDYAVVELVRASLDAGSTDNVTCVVADVLDDAAVVEHADELADLQPLLVGSAAELRRRLPRGRNRARGHARPVATPETGADTAVGVDELPEHAIAADPVDPETARYAPRPPERLHWLRIAMYATIAVGVVWVAGALAWSWSQDQYYVGEDAGDVVIFRGVNTDLPGLSLSTVYESSDLAVADLCSYEASQVADGLNADSLDDARSIVDNLVQQASPTGCQDG
ncbi:Stp1/IreP family PP2C-type Ser/Thr phosphatase [Nocardioides fonticola]|uniref:Stp1/IreP family PP2C-type Ser/Thr phosphatase n=1 Tax=Nocardioides fonticola TaxID=450363 RepID=A0ABP7XR85_9ACTN